MPLESQKQADKVVTAISAEAKERNYPLVCKAVSTQLSATGEDNFVTRSHVEPAMRLIAMMKGIYAKPHTLVLVKEDEIPHLDLAGYKLFRTEMEAADFRYLGEIEIPELSRVPHIQMARTMTRYMLSTQGDIIATYFQNKSSLSQIFKSLGRGLRNSRIFAAPRHFFSSLKTRHTINLTTEFTDGRFLSTSNATLASRLSTPETIDSNSFPARTPLPELLRAHRRLLAEYLQNKTAQAQPVIMHTLTDITASYQRYRALITAHRATINWITETELQSLSRGKPKLASALYAEVQKLLKDAPLPRLLLSN